MKGDVLEKVLSGALEKGLRHINTGFIYENEEDIGKVLKKWFSKGGKREDLFITSKVITNMTLLLCSSFIVKCIIKYTTLENY